MIYILSNCSDILLKVALKHNKPKPDTLFQLKNTTHGYLERIFFIEHCPTIMYNFNKSY